MSNEDKFYNALFDGDVAVLDQLSEVVADLPWPDGETGRDVLIKAIQWSNEDSVKWVLSKNPEINFVDCGFTALKHVLQIEGDADILRNRSPAELTRVTVCLIDLLIEAGADIKLSGTLGESVLHTAAMWSSPTVIQHLLNHGADPMVFDDEYPSRQPIYYAEFKKRWEAYAIFETAMKSQVK
ncbi:MAG: hypothetical protein ABJQ34_20945 [Paracoccaceae bacterium]